MLKYAVIQGVTSWSGPTGVLKVSKPAPHLLLSSFHGQTFDLPFARLLVDTCEIHAAPHERVCFFHDWELMENCEKDARVLLTDQAHRLSSKLDQLVVFSKSPMVQLSIAMANIPLEGRIQFVNDRLAFDKLLEAARLALPQAAPAA